MANPTTSSLTRSRCTCSQASGTPMTGPHEVDSRRQTGRRPRLCHPTRTSASMVANGRTLIQLVYLLQPRIGGINTLLGTWLMLRKRTMVGLRGILSSMTIARTLRDILHLWKNALWVPGTKLGKKHSIHLGRFLTVVNSNSSILSFEHLLSVI